MDAAEPILVVDGDAECRAVVTRLLQRVGYRTLEAQTGEEALVTLNGERPALVLLEVALPGLSGYEVCRELRAAFGEELPIIFLSGTRTERLDQIAGLLIGADDYVVKPFDPEGPARPGPKGGCPLTALFENACGRLGADTAGTGRPNAARGGSEPGRDRDQARHQPQDGWDTRAARPGQARRSQPRSGGGTRPSHGLHGSAPLR
jgi:CheY-like chemotaxis protein